MSEEAYPDCIKNLPKVKTTLPGVQGWIGKGEEFQIVFFEIEPTATVPPHSHCAQFGIVIDGEMELTIGNETKRYSKGDSYYIPDGVIHHAKPLTFVRAMDFFADSNRYESE